MTEPTDQQIAELLARRQIVEPGADRRRLFKCFLPAAIVISVVLDSMFIERTYPEGDSRNFMGPVIAVVMIGPALVYGVIGVREAIRPGGLRALIWALIWNALLALGPLAIFALLVKFSLAKHA